MGTLLEKAKDFRENSKPLTFHRNYKWSIRSLQSFDFWTFIGFSISDLTFYSSESYCVMPMCSLPDNTTAAMKVIPAKLLPMI